MSLCGPSEDSGSHLGFPVAGLTADRMIGTYGVDHSFPLEKRF